MENNPELPGISRRQFAKRVASTTASMTAAAAIMRFGIGTAKAEEGDEYTYTSSGGTGSGYTYTSQDPNVKS